MREKGCLKRYPLSRERILNPALVYAALRSSSLDSIATIRQRQGPPKNSNALNSLHHEKQQMDGKSEAAAMTEIVPHDCVGSCRYCLGAVFDPVGTCKGRGGRTAAKTLQVIKCASFGPTVSSKTVVYLNSQKLE